MNYLLLVALLSVGCGGNGNDDAMDMSTGPDLRPSADLIGAGTPTDGGGTCLTSTPAGYEPYEVVELFSETASDALAQQRSEIWASIGVSNGVAAPPPTLGCQVLPKLTGPNAGQLQESGGAISVSGGTRVVSAEPDASDDYAFYSSDIVWPANAQLGIDIAGACDVPAKHFDLVMPKAVVPMTPAASAKISSANDMAVTWSPGSAMLRVNLVAKSTTVACVFDASTGSGTVPQAILSQLPLGSVQLSLLPFSQIVTTEAGRYYNVSASASVLTASGTAATPITFTLQ